MKRVYRILGLIVVLAVSVLFVLYAARSLRGHDLSLYATQNAAIGIALMVALWSCAPLLQTLAWRSLLRGLDVYKGRRELYSIIAVSQIGKYIPGHVAQYIGRAGMSLKRDIPAQPLAVTIILESVMTIPAAVVVGVAAGACSDVGRQALRHHSTQLGLIAALAILTAAGLIVLQRIAPPLLQRFAPKFAPSLSGCHLPRLASLVRAFANYCAGYLVVGLGLVLLAHFLLPDATQDDWLLIAAFALAWVVGFLTPGAPGGLGVREGLMLLMLAPVYTAANASVLVIALRIATTLGDLAILVCGVVLMPRAKSTCGDTRICR